MSENIEKAESGTIEHKLPETAEAAKELLAATETKAEEPTKAKEQEPQQSEENIAQGKAPEVEKFEPESLHPSNATAPAPVQREEDKEGDLGSHPDYYHPEAHKPAGAWHDQNPK